MENLQKIVNALIYKKAKENNTIDLNAYAIGALDALEKSKYTKMLEMLEKCKIMCDHLNIHHISNELNALIKEATEI